MIAEFGTEENAKYQYDCLGLDYEEIKPDLNSRMIQIFNAFSNLNRRRIEYNPLQKRDILDEVKYLEYPDKTLYVIESLDSHWLAEQSKKIKSQSGR